MSDDTAAEKLKGTVKETAGKLLGDDSMAREGMQQQEKAEASEDAEQLEQLAAEKRQEAAGHAGAQAVEESRD